MTEHVNVFLDCEFMEDGKTVELLSLALVRDDGRSLYVVNTTADRNKANDWVKTNVIPRLELPGGLIIGDVFVHAKHHEIANHVKGFLAGVDKPHFWGYYADYDWVAFCQIFGTMMDLPKGFPVYCRDIKQLCDSVGNPQLPPQSTGEHHALMDARWNKTAYEFLMAEMESQL